MLEQDRRRNNLVITDIPNPVENNKHEENVLQLLKEIDVNVTSNDTETCHVISKTKSQSKKKVVRFFNQ